MISQTPEFIAQSISDPTRVDFEILRYERIISQKGLVVLIEKSLICPCKTKSSSAQSSCKNCGGNGWIFAPPYQTRMVVQGMNLSTDYAPWSEELKGVVRISSSATEELCFMDKVTLVDAKSIFSEVIFLDGANQGESVVTLGYQPNEMLYVAKFKSTADPLVLLTKNVDYSIVNNVFKLLTFPDEKDISITLRYKHAPVYYILDFNRENMQTFVFSQKEEVSSMPTLAIARRAHYVLNMQNSSNNRLLTNSWPKSAICN